MGLYDSNLQVGLITGNWFILLREITSTGNYWFVPLGTMSVHASGLRWLPVIDCDRNLPFTCGDLATLKSPDNTITKWWKPLPYNVNVKFKLLTTHVQSSRSWRRLLRIPLSVWPQARPQPLTWHSLDPTSPQYLRSPRMNPAIVSQSHTPLSPLS